MCRVFYKLSYTPSWTGFNIMISQNEIVLKSMVHYMECIDAPATDISTINEVLERALKMKEHMSLSCIVCVFDQSMFAKAVEIKWKEPEKFKHCVIMLGTFHTIMMFMAVISKRFKDAGLRDILVQSGVLAEGSVDSAMSGKMYNRGIRAYKLMYEALMSILLDNMETKFEDDPWNLSLYS